MSTYVFHQLRQLCKIAATIAVAVICSASSAFSQDIVAHRGASHAAPENTLAAFRLAWAEDADVIEGDFYLTADRQIVCVHDKTTKRVAPTVTPLTIATSTLDELRKLDVGSWKHERYHTEVMPTLTEVLDVVPKGKRIFVEIKCGPEIVPVLQKQISASDLQPAQIVFIAFSESVVTACRKAMPEIKASWLTSFSQSKLTRRWSPSPEKILQTLDETGATGVGVKSELKVVDRALVQRVHDAGKEFHVWTVNDAEDAKRLSAMGVDSITTDRPAHIRNSLKSPANSSKTE